MFRWCCLAFCLVCCSSFSFAATQKPHIVMIVADDLGWDDVSFHGSNQIPTPGIDYLANNGIILNNYYVQPVCTPTRSCFMTGRYPIHTGLQNGVIMGWAPYGLGLDEKTLPQYLKELGYSTHGIGKWHLGFYKRDYTPTYRGFDSYFGLWTGKEDYYAHTSDEYYGYIGYDLNDGTKEVARDYQGQYGTELFTSKAIDVIKSMKNVNTSLFLYLAHQAVHSANPSAPLQAPQHLIDQFSHLENKQRRIYAAMATSLDQSVANITTALKSNGLWNNTVIIFTTDNGGPAYSDFNVACNWPLRGRKATLWEGGIRGVACVHSPLISEKNTKRVSMDLMHATDWLPTIVRLAGGNAEKMKPANKTLDGFDMWDTISKGADSPRTEILHNIDGHDAALRVGDFKLLVGQANNTWYPMPTVRLEAETPIPGAAVVRCGDRPTSGVRDCNATKSPCLFNISADPCEFSDLSMKEPDVVERLMKRLDAYKETVVPSRNKAIDPKSNPKLHGGDWVPWE